MASERIALQGLSTLERRLLDEFQRGFPLAPRPFAVIAARLGASEDEVLAALRRLHERGYVTRLGAVLEPHTVGASTLAALAVPAERLEAVAALVSAHPGVNHNYAREHELNLWFVVTGPDRETIDRILRTIERETGLEPLDLPLIESFHVDLGFPLSWR